MDIENLTPETADSFADSSTTSTESEGFDSSFSEVNSKKIFENYYTTYNSRKSLDSCNSKSYEII